MFLSMWQYFAEQIQTKKQTNVRIRYPLEVRAFIQNMTNDCSRNVGRCWIDFRTVQQRRHAWDAVNPHS